MSFFQSDFLNQGKRHGPSYSYLGNTGLLWALALSSKALQLMENVVSRVLAGMGYWTHNKQILREYLLLMLVLLYTLLWFFLKKIFVYLITVKAERVKEDEYWNNCSLAKFTETFGWFPIDQVVLDLLLMDEEQIPSHCTCWGLTASKFISAFCSTFWICCLKLFMNKRPA